MDIQEAFATLVDQLRQALRQAQAAGERAFREGRFGDAHTAAQRGQEVNAWLDQLESLQREWPRLIQDEEATLAPQRSAARRASQRMARGQRTRQHEFWLPILAALDALGGRGQPADVIGLVEHMLHDRLNDTDRGLLKDGRTIRWHNSAHWARYDMLQQGLLASDSPRGIWEITAEGRAYLRERWPGEASVGNRRQTGLGKPA